MPIITLTTDFGLVDAYVGIMKGVILGICPAAQIVDLSHDIAPQDIAQAMYILQRAAPYFPDGTVHLAVVDPGVGGQRRPLLVQTRRSFFVGPDNGLFTPWLGEEDAQAWELNRPEFWLQPVSATFHGRDIFAPVAAHLARGVEPVRLGRPIEDPVRLPWAQATRHRDGRISGQVVYVDRFGNLISNIRADWVAGQRWRCQIAGREIAGPSRAYADVAPGELVALIGSGDTVEVAVREGNAARHLQVGVGEALTLWPLDG